MRRLHCKCIVLLLILCEKTPINFGLKTSRLLLFNLLRDLFVLNIHSLMLEIYNKDSDDPNSAWMRSSRRSYILCKAPMTASGSKGNKLTWFSDMLEPRVERGDQSSYVGL